ncbi:MAG: DUF1456 family protein [Chitinophagales bacterium]|nr:DUF1456 family protein [Chitinophagales bacterium]
MNNNDVLRQIRYIFNFSDDQMMSIFKLADHEKSRAEISAFLKKEEEDDYLEIQDCDLALFLDGLIISKRGRSENYTKDSKQILNNNIIFRKLKIALNYKDIDILEVFDLADLRISKHEISAFFRNPKQSQYRECKDQFLRNFLFGLKKKIRS